MSTPFDIAVIGGGVLGAFHAYFATQQGYSTLLIERDESPRMATVRNFGMAVPSGMKPGKWHTYGLRGVATYRKLADQIGLPVQFGGTQYVAETELQDTVLKEFVEVAPRHEYHCTYLDQNQSLELNPSLQPGYVRSSVLFPDDLRFDPRTLPKLLLPWLAKQEKLQYHPSTVAQSVRIHGSECEIATDRGDQFVAKNVFVCSGADLKTLYPEFLKKLRYCKLHMMRTAPQPTVKLNASLGTGLTIRRYPAFSLAPSWQQLQQEGAGNELDQHGIHILAVQDPDSRFVLGDSHHYSDTPFDESLNPRTQELLVTESQRIFKLDSWKMDQEWTGVYTVHPEQDILRETVEGRVHLTTGIGGKGMTTSAGVAEANILKLGATL